MKLLDKKTITSQVAGQRRSQIEEGINLAKKIDALRETLSSLEKQQKSFIAGMRAGLEREIGSLQSERNTLQKEIATLKKEKVLLQIPLDSKWEEVRVREKIFEASEKKIEEDRRVLTCLVLENDKASRQIEKQSSKSLEYNRTAEENLSHAQKIVQEAEEKSVCIKDKAKNFLKKVQKREENVLNREALCSSQENKLKKREETIEERERKVSDSERLANDRYQTLLRTEKRIHG